MLYKLKQIFRAYEEYITLIFSFLINLFFYHKNLTSADIQRIVVIKLDHIGDVILSIPAIANLKAAFPKAHITIVVNPSSRLIAALIPYVDDILCYNARFFDRSHRTKIFDFARGMSFARDMRRKGFDLIIDLRGSFASLLFALIAKSRYRIDRGSYLISRKLHRGFPKHEADINLDILSRAGIKIQETELSLKLPLDDARYADLLLKSPDPAINVVIHPGGPMELKRWSIENYNQLIRQLFQKYHARIFLVGGRDEAQIAHSIVSAINNECIIDLSGQLTLSQLAAVLQRADIFIGNDSGPMHIASACGTKVIGLFGPTAPERFSPYGVNCVALRMEHNCLPCSKEKCKFPNYRCIDQITVDDVMKTAGKLLKGNRLGLKD